MGFKLAEEKKFVPVLYTADYGAGVDFDSINMKNFIRCTFVIGFGAIAGNAVLTINSGATNGAKTSALTFHYAFGSAARGSASCDVLATTATSAALTLTGTAYDNFMLIAEVDGADMDVDNEEEWLTAAISSAGTSGIAFAFAILEPRYTGAQSGTALA
jgi:hypothetical protein